MNKTKKNFSIFGVYPPLNPPASPHFGGLREAAVRSSKHHLKRIIGDSTLTFEELSTLLTAIEASLNSRPLSPINDDLSDFRVLTPSHLLIGRSMLSLPENSCLDFNPGQLTRWMLLNKMRENSGEGHTFKAYNLEVNGKKHFLI